MNTPNDTTQTLDPSAHSKAFQEKAFEHASRWMKTSKEFMARRLPRWRLLRDLYHNRVDLKSWSEMSQNTAPLNSERPTWQSDIVLSPSHIVDTWADRAYQAIFSGPEWLTVIPEAPAGDEAEDYPTSFKLRELLLTRLSLGQIHIRMYEALQQLVLYGSVYAKLVWYSKQIPCAGWDTENFDVTIGAAEIYDCPILQIIPPEELLIDWAAGHGDVQRHSGIAHCVHKSYDYIMDQFRAGIYDLNQDRFIERFGGDVDDYFAESFEFDDNGYSGSRKFTVWEWHGGVPTDDGPREVMLAVITEYGSDNPENGVMVRLTDGPILWQGLRPFVTAHYIPQPGPLGTGAVENNLDLIHSISQFLSQSQDNARLTANAQIIVRRGSSAARQIASEGDVVYPGRVWTVDDPDDVRPFPRLDFPQNEVNYLIDYLNRLLEKRTAVNDQALGISSYGRTATEAHILQESSVTPFSVRTDLFARSFIESLGKIALGMLQQFIFEDQVIAVKSSGGGALPLAVSPAEIRSGKYKVAATLTKQDSTRIAKAQSIERALPTLAKFQPLLAQEGVEVSFSEIVKRYLDLIGIEGADRVLHRRAESITEAPIEHGYDNGCASDPAGQSTPAPLIENGGPMGSQQTDVNALAQFLQRNA